MFLDPDKPWVVSADGGATSISVKSNTTWTKISSDPWLSFSGSPTGTNNGSFTITAQPNAANAKRSGTMTVAQTIGGVVTGSSIIRTIEVTQLDEISAYFTQITNGVMIPAAPPSTTTRLAPGP